MTISFRNSIYGDIGTSPRCASRSQPGRARWHEQLFALMSRSALSASAFYRLPPDRVVEIGAQVEL